MLSFFYMWDPVWVFEFRTRAQSPCRGIQLVTAMETKLMYHTWSSKWMELHPLRVTGHRDGTVAYSVGHKRKLGHLKFDGVNVFCDPMLTRKSMAFGEISHSCGILKMRKQGASSYTEGRTTQWEVHHYLVLLLGSVELFQLLLIEHSAQPIGRGVAFTLWIEILNCKT